MSGQRVYYEEESDRGNRDMPYPPLRENPRFSGENEIERLGEAEYFKGEGNKHMAAQVRSITLVTLSV